MNLYLVLAIALGALTGAVEAPLRQPVPLVAERDSRPRRAIRSVRQVIAGRRRAVAGVLRPPARILRPRISGNASPRAPAVA